MQITHDLAIGGLQQVVVNICRTIDRDLFDISVLCLRDLGEFVTDVEKLGIPVFYLQQKENGTDYLSFLKVAKILRGENIEVIHTHNTQPLVDGTIAALLSRKVKTIVHTDHGRAFPDKKRYMFAERVMSHFVYKVVGVSEYTSQNLIKYEKISPHRIMTITNGIDGSRFDIMIDRKRKRDKMGILNNGPVIGLGVRLTWHKGITYLLQAMPRIINAFPEITLVIAGEGPLENEIKKKAISLDVEKNVMFVGPRLDMPELLKLFDLYVLPSVSEGLPIALLEAMAAGCPVIATDVGGISTIITHGVNGSLVKPKNPTALSSEIINLLSDNEKRNMYIKNGLRIFNERFSAEIMTRKYEQLYLRKFHQMGQPG